MAPRETNGIPATKLCSQTEIGGASWKASQIVSGIPPPAQLWEIWGLLPQTVLVVKIDNLAILIDPPSHTIASRLGGKEYCLPYHGYSIKIYAHQWQNIGNNLTLCNRILGDRFTLGILQ